MGKGMTITVGYWETRDGCRARVLCTDAPGEFPAKGYIENGKGESFVMAWTIDGKTFAKGGAPSQLVRPWIDRPVIDWSREREWVKAIVMVPSGDWYRADRVPELSDTGWLFVKDAQHMHKSERPQFTGDWKDSLCVRLEGGGK